MSVFNRSVVGNEPRTDPPRVTVDSVVRDASLERVDVTKVERGTEVAVGTLNKGSRRCTKVFKATIDK